MKTVILKIDDKFSNLLTLTAIGVNYPELHTTVCSVDLKIADTIIIDSNGLSEVIHNNDK